LIQLKPEMKHNPYTWFLYYLERLIYRKSKSIIVCVEKFKNHIVSKGIDEKKIHFISNCTYPNHFTPDKPVEYYKEKYKINRFTVAYTGAIGVANNPYLILDIAKRLENQPIDFLILGEGPLREEIEKKIETIISKMLKYTKLFQKGIF